MEALNVTDEPSPPPRRGAAASGHFISGVLESASHILGSTSAGIFAVGLVGPYIALLMDPRSMSPKATLGVAALAFAFSVAAGVGAVTLRGLAHHVGHEASRSAEPVR